MGEEAKSNSVQMQAQWIQDLAQVPAPVNQFLIQGGPDIGGSQVPDSFVITFGHLTPPPMPQFESQEEARAFASANVALISAVARLTFTPGRLRELHGLLGQVIEQFDIGTQPKR